MIINLQQLLSEWGDMGIFVALMTVAGFFIRRWVLRIDCAITELTNTVNKLDKNQVMIYSALRFRNVIPQDDFNGSVHMTKN